MPFAEVWNAGYGDTNVEPLMCRASNSEGVSMQQHLAMGAQAGVHIAIGGYLHPTHTAQALGKDGNFKACGQLEAAQQGFRKWDGAWLENRHHGLAAHGLRRGRVVPTKQRAEGHAGQAHENWSG